MLLLVRATSRDEVEQQFNGAALFITEFNADVDVVDIRKVDETGRRTLNSS